MIYTTMTRNRVRRLVAKGWLLTGRMILDLDDDAFDYFEVSFDKYDSFSILRGHGYTPEVAEYLEIGDEDPKEILF